MLEGTLTEPYSADAWSTEAAEFPAVILGPSFVQWVVADSGSIVGTVGKEIHAGRWSRCIKS